MDLVFDLFLDGFSYVLDVFARPTFQCFFVRAAKVKNTKFGTTELQGSQNGAQMEANVFQRDCFLKFMEHLVCVIRIVFCYILGSGAWGHRCAIEQTMRLGTNKKKTVVVVLQNRR